MSLAVAPKVAWFRKRTAALEFAESFVQAGGAGGGVKVCEPSARVKCPPISPLGKAVDSMTMAALPSPMISRMSEAARGPVPLIFQR